MRWIRCGILARPAAVNCNRTTRTEGFPAMPLLQYFGWVGSFLVAALLAANWCFPAPIVPGSGFDVPLDHKFNIRIHTDHKWPERLVFDTRGSTLSQKADAETSLRESEP